MSTITTSNPTLAAEVEERLSPDLRTDRLGPPRNDEPLPAETREDLAMEMTAHVRRISPLHAVTLKLRLLDGLTACQPTRPRGRLDFDRRVIEQKCVHQTT